MSFPFTLQSLHRYAMYTALVFLVILLYDLWHTFWFTDAVTGRTQFGLGVGTLVLLANIGMLGSYTLGCHSMRHITSAGVDEPVHRRLLGPVRPSLLVRFVRTVRTSPRHHPDLRPDISRQFSLISAAGATLVAP